MYWLAWWMFSGSLTVNVGCCRSVVRRESRGSVPAIALFEGFGRLAVTWVLGDHDHCIITCRNHMLPPPGSSLSTEYLG